MITLYISLAAALAAVALAVAFALRGGGLDERWIYIRPNGRPKVKPRRERRRAGRAKASTMPADGPPAAGS